MAGWFNNQDATGPYFCVVGSPVAHSKSPFIHNAFAAQTGRALTYQRIEVRSGELRAAFDEFRALGGVGMNVTVPLKEEAWQLALHRAVRADAARAANTLWMNPAGEICADNTDGAGLVTDLTVNLGLPLRQRDVLLLGAGGAARGVVPALLDAGVRTLRITNRTAARATALVDEIGDSRLETVAWGDYGGRAPDLLLNATALSLGGELPPLPAAAAGPDTLCYDMMYSDEPTVFMRWAQDCGAARAVDGLGMLVEQAAEAYCIWHGERPLTAPVMQALRP